MVPRMEKRVSTVSKLGYKKCIVSKTAEKSPLSLENMKFEIVGCRNLKEDFQVLEVRMVGREYTLHIAKLFC